MRNTLLITFLLLSLLGMQAQTVAVTVGGFVKDSESGAALPGASVYSSDNRYGQTTGFQHAIV